MFIIKSIDLPWMKSFALINTYVIHINKHGISQLKRRNTYCVLLNAYGYIFKSPSEEFLPESIPAQFLICNN